MRCQPELVEGDAIRTKTLISFETVFDKFRLTVKWFNS